MNKPEICPVCGAPRANSYDENSVDKYYECRITFTCSSQYVLDADTEEWVEDTNWLCPHMPEKLRQAKEDLKALDELIDPPLLFKSEHALWREIRCRWGL